MNQPAATHPPYLYPGYRSTVTRAPGQPLVAFEPTLSERTGPLFRAEANAIGPEDHDLTRQSGGEPLGERIIVAGRILDENGRGVAHTLVELWQANAAGRYRHAADTHPAPIDANFLGAGRTFTDADGGYRFVTIKPGAYPWRNHDNAWRPAHLHFSVFGRAFPDRLVTQMYFPRDPLMPLDPILQSVPNEGARDRLVSAFDLSLTKPEWALGYRFDIVLRGVSATPSQTLGPFFNFGLTNNPALGRMAGPGARGERIRLAIRIVDGEGNPARQDAMVELWQADANGRYAHPADPGAAGADPDFRAFGRLDTDADGFCAFETIKPGAVLGQAPHINVAIFARGLLKQLYTRIYFARDAASELDAALRQVPADRRDTLFARFADGRWEHEIRLQGPGETVFFTV